ncbi:Capsular polysaccharide synthesis protein [Methylomagnum ishizawai]|uniref:Capsular polysaccharide synthesis protein n=1 Tax=Methylomagnum ishizawai TaxID=1760988 RepID=A0A1Y6CU87_9GAMM|nr:capsular polysaccharide synthesis protein [Methylomagnum ishizawai]SMF94188.1 Capsular polysaccharide synthesis protein [Methylomagnum ishizawai]
MNENAHRGDPPRIIWLLWLQGWDQAPEVAWAGRTSWEKRNPGWQVHALDQADMVDFLSSEGSKRIFSTPKQPEAMSDQIRLELLHQHGGVWADATTLCARPLDDWLPQAMPNGFFAFYLPERDRMISSWFLAAEKGAYIVEKWREAAWRYWEGRERRDNYFWAHRLFTELHGLDPRFRALWEGTPRMPSYHRFHFGPRNAQLSQEPPPEIERLLASPPSPVFKLTHKFDTPPGPGSLMERLCAFARE